MTAQDYRATYGRPFCYATICAASFHPPRLALLLARATLFCENMATETTLETTTNIEPNHAPSRP